MLIVFLTSTTLLSHCLVLQPTFFLEHQSLTLFPLYYMHTGLENSEFDDIRASISAIVYAFISGCARTHPHRKTSQDAVSLQH